MDTFRRLAEGTLTAATDAHNVFKNWHGAIREFRNVVLAQQTRIQSRAHPAAPIATVNPVNTGCPLYSYRIETIKFSLGEDIALPLRDKYWNHMPRIDACLRRLGMCLNSGWSSSRVLGFLDTEAGAQYLISLNPDLQYFRSYLEQRQSELEAIWHPLFVALNILGTQLPQIIAGGTVLQRDLGSQAFQQSKTVHGLLRHIAHVSGYQLLPIWDPLDPYDISCLVGAATFWLCNFILLVDLLMESEATPNQNPSGTKSSLNSREPECHGASGLHDGARPGAWRGGQAPLFLCLAGDHGENRRKFA